ncbi:unnamed protein product [Paramecium sonneborni]|uniref:Uncharacterized protein n=1 Tax=Paramecium sonneborni TaxID=65129 RepID=A0A8S1LEN6_9CILI|nr:unnamed protein product [Paramecium sonneborni]CAD8066230.1 unnamed protein product [Paramecium sonneborni]CAD8066231.1 unnamed protein product [Paramecium sonneborni]
MILIYFPNELTSLDILLENDLNQYRDQVRILCNETRQFKGLRDSCRCLKMIEVESTILIRQLSTYINYKQYRWRRFCCYVIKITLNLYQKMGQ